jgi:hypothetical protein
MFSRNPNMNEERISTRKENEIRNQNIRKLRDFPTDDCNKKCLTRTCRLSRSDTVLTMSDSMASNGICRENVLGEKEASCSCGSIYKWTEQKSICNATWDLSLYVVTWNMNGKVWKM